jgi:hypothetical protein
MNLRIDDSNLTRDHVIAWLRSHLGENPPPSRNVTR